MLQKDIQSDRSYKEQETAWGMADFYCFAQKKLQNINLGKQFKYIPHHKLYHIIYRIF